MRYLWRKMRINRFHLNYTKKRGIIILATALLLVMIYFFKNSSFSLRAIATIAALVIFYGLDHVYDIRYRKRHYVFMFIILVFTVMFSPIYYLYPSYDKLQHFFLPMLVTSLVFYMVNKL